MSKAKTRTPLTEAQQDLVAKNTRLVGKVLALYFPYLKGDDYEEGWNEGLYGLCKAAQAFDPGLGWQFSTYGCLVTKRHLVSWVEKHQKRGFRGLGHNKLAFPLNVEDGVLDGRPDRERAPAAADIFTLGKLEPLVRRLPAVHQLVIREIYQNKTPYDEVGRRLGLSRGRAQQIKVEAEGMLRGAYREAA